MISHYEIKVTSRIRGEGGNRSMCARERERESARARERQKVKQKRNLKILSVEEKSMR